jgi:hypothetical protein
VKATDKDSLDAVIAVMVGAEAVVTGVPVTEEEGSPSPSELIANNLIW